MDQDPSPEAYNPRELLAFDHRVDGLARRAKQRSCFIHGQQHGQVLHAAVSGFGAERSRRTYTTTRTATTIAAAPTTVILMRLPSRERRLRISHSGIERPSGHHRTS